MELLASVFFFSIAAVLITIALVVVTLGFAMISAISKVMFGSPTKNKGESE